MSPDKPKTPVSERLQAEHANDMFRRGSSIKDTSGKANLGDMRNTGGSKRYSGTTGAAAVKAKYKHMADRRSSGTSTADAASSIRDRGTAMAEVSTAGKDLGKQTRQIRQGISSTATTGSVLSKMDNQKSMDESMASNSKKQAALDAVTGIGMAATTGVFDTKKTPGKVNPNSGPNSTRSMTDQASEYLGDPYEMMDDPLAKPKLNYSQKKGWG
jgi:hypothetical protein